MVVDFKYNKKDGIKICEVQPGAFSSMTGDSYLSNDSISHKIAEFFDRFALKKWVAGPIYPPLQNCLISKGWNVQRSLRTLSSNSEFINSKDPGIVYATCDIMNNYKQFINVYPNIIFIDNIILPYQNDKSKMNELFKNNKYKADWKLYPKKYDPNMANEIKYIMPSDLYVIKPIKEFLANGIIIVKNDDLDTTLNAITNKDPKYKYWSKNKNATFIVEKYYESDYLNIVRNNEVYQYDATMRIAFIMMYSNNKIIYHSLGGYWKLPHKALNEEGTLNEQRISYCKIPFYESVNPELFKEIDIEMEKAMILLYQEMLTASI